MSYTVRKWNGKVWETVCSATCDLAPWSDVIRRARQDVSLLGGGDFEAEQHGKAGTMGARKFRAAARVVSDFTWGAAGFWPVCDLGGGLCGLLHVASDQTFVTDATPEEPGRIAKATRAEALEIRRELKKAGEACAARATSED